MKNDGLDQQKMRDGLRAEERSRLALELHDSVGQVLILAKLQLSRIQDTLRHPLDPEQQEWVRRTIESLLPDVDVAVRAIQDQLFVLDATTIMSAGLAATLEHECTAFIRRTGLSCTRRFDTLEVDAEQGALIVLIVREALANIARHSHATSVQMVLEAACDRGMLWVRDNGIGLDTARARSGQSLGVRGMEQRARALGGELSLNGTPNEGTTLTVSFPLLPCRQNMSLLGEGSSRPGRGPC